MVTSSGGRWLQVKMWVEPVRFKDLCDDDRVVYDDPESGKALGPFTVKVQGQKKLLVDYRGSVIYANRNQIYFRPGIAPHDEEMCSWLSSGTIGSSPQS